MDETYLKVKDQWVYLYRVVDKLGDTVDFMLSEKRDEAVATAFFKQAKITMDFRRKSLWIIAVTTIKLCQAESLNLLLMLAGISSFVEILQIKYLNNLVEQDHRFIKKITKPMMGFKAFHSAKATIAGIETAHMIRKGQLSEENIPAYKQFMALVG
jgi:putative transposase